MAQNDTGNEVETMGDSVTTVNDGANHDADAASREADALFDVAPFDVAPSDTTLAADAGIDAANQPPQNEPRRARASLVERLSGAWDWLIASTLVVVYCVWLVNTVHDLGYARDEGFYFQAADAYLQWFRVLWSDPAEALERETIDKYWRVNSEHPALIKSLFALSKAAFWDGVRLFPERGTSYRFVGMAMSALAVGVVYLWGVRHLATFGTVLARVGALVGALSFALMPQVFYHAHLDCFDMPVTAMGVFTTYAYWRALQTRRWSWAIWTAVLYGLMLNSKHNAWLLPFALVGHQLWSHGGELWRGLRAGKPRIPAVLVLMATLGPLVFYATWPWIWHDTIDRFRDYVVFHTRHVFYNMEFLGKTYFEPPFPRSYAWLMTAATVPAITLGLFGAGVLIYLRREVTGRVWPWLSSLRDASRTPEIEVLDAASLARQSTMSFWLMCIGVCYAPWLFASTPIFGGTKHWMTAYPYFGLFAGYAFVGICRGLGDVIEAAGVVLDRGKRLASVTALAAGCLIGPLVMTIQSHPWGLAAYTPVVGGAAGAATLGLNRSFWGYSTGAIQEEINAKSTPGSRVFIHDTAMQSWHMMVLDKRLRKDLRPQLGVAESDLAIYHHEQHMAKVEYMIWAEYGTTKPSHVGTYDGVPVVWLYERPKTTAAPRRETNRPQRSGETADDAEPATDGRSDPAP